MPVDNSSSQKFAVLPYSVSRIRRHYLVATQWGGWAFLDGGQFRKLNAFNFNGDPQLVRDLRRGGIIADSKNFGDIIREFRQLHASLFYDTGLHIVVVTDNCNFGCLYCQTKKRRKPRFMDLKVATKVLEFMFSGNNPNIRLEFQGGEPLLNWKAVEFLITYSHRQNKIEKKNLTISLVSNLSLLNKKILHFLLKNDVEICTSLDGPRQVHDKNRIFRDTSPTYDNIVKHIRIIQSEYKKRGINKIIGALPTITRQGLPYAKEIIDEYVSLGFNSIHLRPISNLGEAKANWDRIGYTAEEFNNFWKEGLDYILALNKKGVNIKETMALIMLKKVLKKQDPLYVDLDSPCGAGRSQLAYDPNGDVYVCDEARMIGSDIFKLGNVKRDKYQDVMKSHNLFYASQASLLNLWDYNSAFCAWSGTCPVMNFHEQGSPVVKISQTPKYKMHNFQLGYLFGKIQGDKEARAIFNKWIS